MLRPSRSDEKRAMTRRMVSVPRVYRDIRRSVARSSTMFRATDSPTERGVPSSVCCHAGRDDPPGEAPDFDASTRSTARPGACAHVAISLALPETPARRGSRPARPRPRRSGRVDAIPRDASSGRSGPRPGSCLGLVLVRVRRRHRRRPHRASSRSSVVPGAVPITRPPQHADPVADRTHLRQLVADETTASPSATRRAASRTGLDSCGQPRGRLVETGAGPGQCLRSRHVAAPDRQSPTRAPVSTRRRTEPCTANSSRAALEAKPDAECDIPATVIGRTSYKCWAHPDPRRSPLAASPSRRCGRRSGLPRRPRSALRMRISVACPAVSQKGMPPRGVRYRPPSLLRGSRTAWDPAELDDRSACCRDHVASLAGTVAPGGVASLMSTRRSRPDACPSPDVGAGPRTRRRLGH